MDGMGHDPSYQIWFSPRQTKARILFWAGPGYVHSRPRLLRKKRPMDMLMAYTHLFEWNRNTSNMKYMKWMEDKPPIIFRHSVLPFLNLILQMKCRIFVIYHLTTKGEPRWLMFEIAGFWRSRSFGCVEGGSDVIFMGIQVIIPVS